MGIVCEAEASRKQSDTIPGSFVTSAHPGWTLFDLHSCMVLLHIMRLSSAADMVFHTFIHSFLLFAEAAPWASGRGPSCFAPLTASLPQDLTALLPAKDQDSHAKGYSGGLCQ